MKVLKFVLTLNTQLWDSHYTAVKQLEVCFRQSSICRISIYLSIYLVISSPLYAQSDHCNKIKNHTISYNNSAAIGHSEPFNLLYVDGWYGIGTPQIDTVIVTAGYKEDYTLTDCSSTTILQDMSGGAKVELTNSIFSRNYIDVLFREYDNQQMHFDIDVCGQKDPGHALNDSKIENCVFTLPAVQQYCNSIKQELAVRISGVGGKCHIVDLAETSIHYQPLFYDDGIGGMGQNMRGYISYYSSVNFLSTNITLMPLRINNNTYSLPCANIKLYK